MQSLPYALDSVTSPHDEYPRYPIETLVDEGGDCEDTSILLASLIHSMGYGVVLVEFPNHCGIGIKGGENVYGTYYEYGGSKYFYLETIGENWGIGELPDEYQGVSAQIYPMVPTPILTHEWTVTGEGYYAILEVKVTDLGTATANNVYVYSGFDAGNDKLWNPVQSNTVSIEPGYQYTTTLYIQVPLGKHTRLVVQIAMDGYSVEKSYSEWFDT